MSTMKKLFALTLALAMLLSVAAFAGFTDRKSIDEKCIDDVQLLTALGIIKGNADGSFGPKNPIKRSEAAAMIYRLRNGGIDDNAEAWKDGESKFTDVVKGSWYSGYVAYCEYFGIIDGKSATEFRPNDYVTTIELAKMLLVVAGYKSSVEGYTGSDWAKNVLADAEEAKLFKNFGGSYAGNCSREWACKLMVNAIDAETAVYLGDYRLPTAGETVGAKYLSIKESSNYIVIANDTWSVVNGGRLETTTGAAISNTLNRYKYENERKLAKEGNILLAKFDDITAYKAGTLTADDFYAKTLEVKAADSSIVGQEVKVAMNKDNVVLGYAATGNGSSGKLNISYDETSGKYSVKVGVKVYVEEDDGTGVLAAGIYDAMLSNIWLADKSVDATKAVLAYYDEENLYDLTLVRADDVSTIGGYYSNYFNYNREAEFRAYDFNGDQKIDAVISNVPVYAKSSAYNADTNVLKFKFGVGNNTDTWNSNGQTTVDVPGTIVGAAAANAFYKITFDYTTGLRTLTKVEDIVGKVEALSYADGKIEKVTINGVDYTFYTHGYKQYTVVEKDNLARGGKDSNWESLLGKLVSYSFDSKGNLVRAFAYTPNSGNTSGSTPSTIDSSKLAYLVEKKDVVVPGSSTPNEWGETIVGTPKTVTKIKVMFADGNDKIFVYDDDSKLTGAAKSSALTVGKVYEYSVNSDGDIVLFTNLSAATNVVYGAGNKGAAAAAASLSNNVAFNLDKSRFGDVLVDDNTIIFVKYVVTSNGNSTDVYTVMKISEFKKGINTKEFNLVARDGNAISTALVATVEFAGGLPTDPSAPPAAPNSYLIYVTSGTVKFNKGEDNDGNPINVAKFNAVDLTTGVEGEYYLADVTGSVTEGAILSGVLNADGLIEAAPTVANIVDFAGTLTASSWLKGKVAAKSGDLLLIDSKLIDKDNLAEKYSVLKKSGTSFSVATYGDITEVAKDQDNNIVIRTDAEGKIDLIIFTANGKAF